MEGRCEALTKRRQTKCRNRATGDDGLCTVHRRIETESMAAPECPICLSKIQDRRSVTTPCNHVYHATCLDRWIRRGATTCPTCRSDLETRQPQPHPHQTTYTHSPSLNMRHILDMIIQFTPSYNEASYNEASYNEEFYSIALSTSNAVNGDLMTTQYLPRDLVTEVASRSPTANIIMQFLEDIQLI